MSDYHTELENALRQFAIATHRVEPGEDESANFQEALAAINATVKKYVIGEDETHFKMNLKNMERDKLRAEQRAIIDSNTKKEVSDE